MSGGDGLFADFSILSLTFLSRRAENDIVVSTTAKRGDCWAGNKEQMVGWKLKSTILNVASRSFFELSPTGMKISGLLSIASFQSF